jgi:ABC-2 type transport system ATP-binding protein
MKKLGRKQLTLHLRDPLAAIPAELEPWGLELREQGRALEFRFDTSDERSGVPSLLQRLGELGIVYVDLNTQQSSLEDIFVRLVSAPDAAGARA